MHFICELVLYIFWIYVLVSALCRIFKSFMYIKSCYLHVDALYFSYFPKLSG